MFVISLLSFIVYSIVLAIYRLYFHPLSKFPGPKLAAITVLHEFYYNVIRDGMFVWEIEKMHKEYGPIVRINPHELHINDRAFYEEIYTSSSSKREKYWSYVKGLGLPQSVVSTIDHNHHGSRRKHLTNFFSMSAVRNIEPLIHEKLDKMVMRLQKSQKVGQLVDLSIMFHALAVDTISHYAYGTNYNCLDMDDLEQDVRDSLMAITGAFHLMRFVPLDPTMIQKIPLPILNVLWPDAAKVLETKRRVRNQALEALGGNKKPERETLFTTLMSAEVQASEKSLDRLQDEAFLLLQAGSETTGQNMSIAMFYILRNPDILARMRQELLEVMPKPTSRPTLAQLQALPYFSAVIVESFRLAFGTLTRLPRVAPEDVLRYKGWAIPPGTPLSQNTYFLHTDPEMFPDPYTFDPERWIRAGKNRKHLESMLVNWSKGRRQCLGINLAQAEIYIAIAHLVRRADLTLLDPGMDSIKPCRDRVMILPKGGAYHIKARVNAVDAE